MERKISPSSKLHIATLKFALYPKRTLRVSLHTCISTNPHEIFNRIEALSSNNGKGDQYAILDAVPLISLTQVGIAANSALLRLSRYTDITPTINNVGQMHDGRLVNDALDPLKRKNAAAEEKELKNDEKKQSGKSQQHIKRRRGPALETIICIGGSTNPASVLKDFAFDKNSAAAATLQNPPLSPSADQRTYDVLFIGYDCESDLEFENVLLKVGLDKPADESVWNTYFARKRNEQEMQEIAKIYKLTPDEVRRGDLESAILNRVATKYNT